MYMILFRFGCSINKKSAVMKILVTASTGQIQRQNIIPETPPPPIQKKTHTQSDHRRPPSPQPRPGVRPGYQRITSTN